MLIAHRIALDPNKRQAAYFSQGCGVSRVAWNWALTEWKRQYEERVADLSLPLPHEGILRRQLNAIKRQQFPWMFDVTKCAVQESIIALGDAFRAFFEKRSGYPRYKAKGVRDSFCAANEAGSFLANGERIKLPKIGWVRMREPVRFSGTLKRATVSREAGRWFVSVLVDTDDIAPSVFPREFIGVDLGVKTLATLSDGTSIDSPKAHKSLVGRLRRAGRSLSRKQKGSANRRKAKVRLARIHARISAIRGDAMHKATTALAKTFHHIGIESLNVKGMAKNRRLAGSIMDAAFFEFRRQLEYKARLYGSIIVVADRWFPSSKTCSCCGSVKTELALSQRIFNCSDCGFETDRDLNAAINLERMAASSAVSACGEERSGAVRKHHVKRASVKQELNSEAA